MWRLPIASQSTAPPFNAPNIDVPTLDSLPQPSTRCDAPSTQTDTFPRSVFVFPSTVEAMSMTPRLRPVTPPPWLAGSLHLHHERVAERCLTLSA